jgi:preprotein translocase subunit SecY
MRLFRRRYQTPTHPDLRHRILYTILLLLVFRVLADIPMFKVDEEQLEQLANNPLLGAIDLLAGGEVLTHFSVVAAGIFPFLLATMIVQGATWIIPSLGELQSQGETGRKRIEFLVTVPIAFILAFIISRYMALQTGLFPGHMHLFTSATIFSSLLVVCLVTLGSLLSAWIARTITNWGVGSGENLVLFAGASLVLAKQAGKIAHQAPDLSHAILRLAFVIIAAILIMIWSYWLVGPQRNVPLLYPRIGTSTARWQPTLPLPLNSGGILPASAAIALLTLGAGLTPTTAWFWGALALLVVPFTYICNFGMIWPRSASDLSLAQKLQRRGLFIPGIRPGLATEAYLRGEVAMFTWVAALSLAFLAAGVPYLIWRLLHQDMTVKVLSIVVVVEAAERLRLEFLAHRSMGSYEGLIRSARVRRRGK